MNFFEGVEKGCFRPNREGGMYLGYSTFLHRVGPSTAEIDDVHYLIHYCSKVYALLLKSFRKEKAVEMAGNADISHVT